MNSARQDLILPGQVVPRCSLTLACPEMIRSSWTSPCKGTKRWIREKYKLHGVTSRFLQRLDHEFPSGRRYTSQTECKRENLRIVPTNRWLPSRIGLIQLAGDERVLRKKKIALLRYPVRKKKSSQDKNFSCYTWYHTYIICKKKLCNHRPHPTAKILNFIRIISMYVYYERK